MRLTDDVWGLHVVCELVLVVVGRELVHGPLQAGPQDLLQHVQLLQVATQTVDPQCLLVAHHSPPQVGFTWRGGGGQFSFSTCFHQNEEEEELN